MNTTLKRVLMGLSLALCLGGQAAHAQQADAQAQAPAQEPTQEPAQVATAELDRILESGTLRVGVNPNFKPFSFLDDEQARVGVDVDIARRLATALGVELELIAPDEFAELIPMLVDEKIDVILGAMSITFERAMEVNFTAPYFDTGISVMMNIGQSARLGIADARDSVSLVDALAGRSGVRIAVTEGKAPALEAQQRFPDATITGYPTNEEAAQAIADGNADLMIHDEVFLKLWLQESEGSTRNRLVVLDPPITPDSYGIAVRKGDSDWLRLLDLFVSELRAEGAVLDYVVDYLPGMSTGDTSESVIPLFELRDME